jgi:hypothetical protein
MHSPILRHVGKVVWLITGLAALNMGLAAFMGWDFFATDFMMNSMWFLWLCLAWQ